MAINVRPLTRLNQGEKLPPKHASTNVDDPLGNKWHLLWLGSWVQKATLDPSLMPEIISMIIRRSIRLSRKEPWISPTYLP